MIRIRVLLADDHAVVRSGVRRLLEQQPGVHVVAEAESGEQAYQLHCEHQPDIAILDISMPGMGGMEALRRILSRDVDAKMLVFSMHENAAFASQAIKAGARGYVAKTGAPDELVKAITEIMRGRNYISASVAQKVALHSLMDGGEPFQLLTGREFEIFRLLATGKNASEIAEIIRISPKTVANYSTIIKQKLGVSTSVELIRLAIQYGIIED
jgi:DNA-binding NarL/FixJ family response regulator